MKCAPPGILSPRRTTTCTAGPMIGPEKVRVANPGNPGVIFLRASSRAIMLFGFSSVTSPTAMRGVIVGLVIPGASRSFAMLAGPPIVQRGQKR
jgi:hypothetical protein